MLKKLSAMVSTILETTHGRREPSRFQPSVEAFEERVVPTVTLKPLPFGRAYIEIIGNDNRDVVTVAQVGPRGRTIQVTENGVSTSFANPRVPVPYSYSGATTPKITNIVFEGRGGNDRFVNDTNTSSQASGGNGIDLLMGGRASDVLHGDAGEDTLFGNGGRDELYGGTQRDYLFGGADADTLDGGDDGAADFLQGDAGADRFQMEGYGVKNHPYLMYFNLDDPNDFAAEDTMYGDDGMVIQPIVIGPVLR